MHLRPVAVFAALIEVVALIFSAQAASSAKLDHIQHVVVLMNENRSTDSYFALMHAINPAFEAQPATASNPDPTDPSKVIRPFHQTSYCASADLDHSWQGAHAEYDNGKMDGFTARNVDPSDPTGSRTMGYYTKDDLPFYYSLYNTFATSDRYFSSLLGPTYPNRFYLYSATSFGLTSNNSPSGDPKSVFNLLDAKKISWKVYFTEVPFTALYPYVQKNAAGHLFPISQYYADAAAGQLPQVSYIDPGYFGTRNTESDEHPPANIQTGQLATSKIVGAFTSSSDWSSSAMFITYDESGGFYDHVPPPSAPIPDATPAQGGTWKFDRYGFRVPVVVVSPYARNHYVSHVVQDHTSILKFIETRYGLPNLTNRDKNADAMLGMFNFNHPAFMTPPTLASASIDPAQAAACQAADVSSNAPSLQP